MEIPVVINRLISVGTVIIGRLILLEGPVTTGVLIKYFYARFPITEGIEVIYIKAGSTIGITDTGITKWILGSFKISGSIISLPFPLKSNWVWRNIIWGSGKEGNNIISFLIVVALGRLRALGVILMNLKELSLSSFSSSSLILGGR